MVSYANEVEGVDRRWARMSPCTKKNTAKIGLAQAL